MSELQIWAVIGALALSTVITRASFLLAGHRIKLPARVEDMLRYAPGCALAAIVAPDLMLGASGEVHLSLANLKLVAGVAAIGFYMLRRNMLETIVFGMLSFTALRIAHVFGVSG
ncbi:MAG: AzlD domain-containing protein [Massilia sp.]